MKVLKVESQLGEVEVVLGTTPSVCVCVCVCVRMRAEALVGRHCMGLIS